MINSNQTYAKGRETIFLVTIVMAIIGFIGNLVLNIYNHSYLLNLIYIVSITLLIGLTISFIFFKIRTALLYSITASIVIATILIAQVLISSNVNFDHIVEKHLLTNILYILITIIITGFVVGFKVSFAQFLILISFVIIRPLQVDMPYISQNLPLILPLMIGLFIGVSFFIKNLEFFIVKINQQNLKLEAENKEVLDNIQYAKRIQNTILPDSNKLNEVLNQHFVFVKNKRIVSNSFYYVEQKNNNTFIAVVNCKGDNVSGALITVVVNYTLDKAIRDLELTSPSEIINYIKSFLTSEMNNIEGVAEKVEIVLCVMSDQKLTYSNDGNYLWVTRKEKIKEIEENFNEGNDLVLDLEKEDIVYLFSSGGMKQVDSNNKVKGRKEDMKKLLASISQHKMDSQINLMNDFWDKNFLKEEQIDDVCGIAFKI